MRDTSKLFIFSLTLLFFASCAPKPESENKLGQVHFTVSGKAEAKPYFEKGVLLLHSFEYDDAAESFLKAQEIDPDFTMAYWGEAMTYNHNLWREQDYEKGQSALKKIAETKKERKNKAKTEIEKELLQATEILFGEGKKKERDQAYSKYLAKLHEKYPKNNEIAAFYALSLLGSVPMGRDETIYEQGAIIAKGILKENPNHPGALHYLIHSYDDPKHAFMALDAANSYAVVAPDASHALHMPSHIYVALGMWDRVIKSNEDSWQASLNRMQRKNLSNDARGYHAFHWLQYGLLQQGKNEMAKTILEDMIKYAEEEPSSRARSHVVLLKGTYLLESGDWQNVIANTDIDTDDLNVSIRARHNFINGMLAYKNHDETRLEQVIEKMKQDRKTANVRITSKGTAMCGGSNRAIPNQLDVDQAMVMEMELLALQAILKNDPKTTENLLLKATELEAKISYSYGPPFIVQPSYELYGEWLMENDRPEDAMIQFEKALKKGPKRVIALKGKLSAAKALNKENLVTEIENTLAEIEQKANQLEEVQI